MDGSMLESNIAQIRDTKLSVLLKTLEKMSKRPSIEADLSQVLEEYLQKLYETDAYLENGIMNMNFAEAALLLQSSAHLYGKKVDLLWDFIFDYQQRIVMSSEDKDANKAVDIANLEERKRKCKRRRKVNLDETKTKGLVTNFSFGQVDDFDYLHHEYEPNDLLKDWSSLNVEPAESTRGKLHLCKNAPFLPEQSVYTDDRDYIGRYNQFHSASVIEEMFQLADNNLLRDENDCITKLQIDCYVPNDFGASKNIPNNSTLECYNEQIKEHITAKDLGEDFLVPSPQTKKCFVSIQRLSFDVVRENLRRHSLADSLMDGDTFSHTEDVEDSENLAEIFKENNEPHNTSNTSLDNEVEALLTGQELDHDNEPLIQLVRNADNRNKSCSQDSAFFEFDNDMDDDLACKAELTVSANFPMSQLCLGGSVSIVKLQRTKIPVERKKRQKIVGSPPVKKRRINEKLLWKLSAGITAPCRQFEIFFRSNYKTGDDEGVVPTEFSFDSDSDDDNDVPEDLPVLPPTIVKRSTGIPNSDPQTTLNSKTLHCESSAMFDSAFGSCNSEPEMHFEEEEAFRKSVQEWRSFIMPRLRSMENRSDFDIHKYGAEIIEPHNVGTKIMFADLVHGKSPAEVTRHFIAALHLANSNNMEIGGTVSGCVSNETFSLTVKDKTRYYEFLEEYQAPSEESFVERLERAKAMNPKTRFHSTPTGAPPSKRSRLNGSSSRRSQAKVLFKKHIT